MEPRAWAGGPWDFLGQEGTPEIALASSSLFYPLLVEVDGCILLKEKYELRDESLGGSRADASMT